MAGMGTFIRQLSFHHSRCQRCPTVLCCSRKGCCRSRYRVSELQRAGDCLRTTRGSNLPSRCKESTSTHQKLLAIGVGRAVDKIDIPQTKWTRLPFAITILEKGTQAGASRLQNGLEIPCTTKANVRFHSHPS